MKSELIKQFVKRVLRKIVIFTFFMIVVSAINQSIGPLVTNQIALGQMQNSDVMYVIMSMYSKLRPVWSAIFAGVTIWFTYAIGRDVYKFVRTIAVENEKEN